MTLSVKEMKIDTDDFMGTWNLRIVQYCKLSSNLRSELV